MIAKYHPSFGCNVNQNRGRNNSRKSCSRPTIGEAILKRATSNRPEMRTFLNRLTEQQLELMGKQFYSLIADSVENLERPEAVRELLLLMAS